MSDLAIPIPILPAMIVDGNAGVIEEVNKACATLLGWDPTDLAGAPLDAVVPPRSQGIHKVERHKYMQKPENRQMGPDRQVQIVRRDGSEIEVWIGLSPLENGQVIAAILPIGSLPKGG